ncbi:MFS transporter, DHA1 family, tetracycline resistance protein [Rhizobium tibeticum]|uniref:MFS transporter, DHA1 family, tetracycline resistance protein n=1 Tax=Rhizobium tibeticum TaxID=501024 RepID=A0A1H8FY78_9HYPH|nr:Tetracycline resistance protein, class C [Rhizobium tibeticum]SEN36048.1 MFS transporter, DHA1 family, tetracycline resistance protein [Rhizobium tibeticum]
MNRPLIVIFTAIVLDAVGIGLIFPILPSLLQEVTHAEDVAPYIGTMTALYAVMQFIFAPVLGALSDRLGRRPVLLISLGGAAINYLFLAFAPNLWMLLLGRAIAGLTSANISVASAYITDISPEEKRARRFGLFNAMFGIGFIIGPVLGGALGDDWLRLPFIAAALLNACNLLLAFFILSETRTPSREKIDLSALNPLRPLRWVFSVKSLLPIIIVFLIFSATGEAYGTCWALWGSDTFQWNGLWTGLLARHLRCLPDPRPGFPSGAGGEAARRACSHSDGHRRSVHCSDRHGLRYPELDDLRDHAGFHPRRHRRAGFAVSGDPAGR